MLIFYGLCGRAEALPKPQFDSITANRISGGQATNVLVKPGPIWRTLESIFSERIDVKNYGATGDGVTDDTGAVAAAYAAANTALAAGTSVQIIFPQGTYRLGALPTLNVPDGDDLLVEGEGTTLVPTTTSSVVSIHEVAAQASTLEVRVQGLDFKASAGGGNALEVIGAPRTQGGIGLRPMITHINCANNGATASFANCLFIADTANGSLTSLASTGGPAPDGDPAGGSLVYLYATPGSGNYSVDTHISDLQFTGGFAAVRTSGHIEGVHIDHMTAVGSSYGVYAPVSDSKNSGVLWMTVTNSHINSMIAGVYCEFCTDLKTTNNLFYSLGTLSPAAASLLPVNYAAVKALVTNGTSAWVGIWCPSCGGGLALSNSRYYGFLRSGQATAGIGLWDIDMGAGLPPDTHANTITGNGISAMTAGSILIYGSTYGNTTVVGNALDVVGPPLSATIGNGAVVSRLGNMADGTPSDASMQNGTFIVNGDVSVSGAIYTPGNINMTTGKSLVLNSDTTGPTWLYANTDGSIYVSAGLKLGGPVSMPVYNVASLPGPCTAGQLAYAANGRKSGEAAGAGTGVPVVCTASGSTTVWSAISISSSAVAN